MNNLRTAKSVRATKTVPELGQRLIHQ